MTRLHGSRCIPFLLACAATLTTAGAATAAIAASQRATAAPVTSGPPAVEAQASSQPQAVQVTPGEATIAPATPAPTTTTTAPPPPPQPTSAAPGPVPPPAPPVAPAPVPPPVRAPAPPAVPPVSPLSLGDRLQAAYEAAVPAAWRNAITISLEPIPGNTSWGWPSGLIQVSERHYSDEAELRVTIAHEFGHLIAYRYGSQASAGAPPAGWPTYSGQPTEAWADCVSRAMTGIDDPSHGLPSCSGASLSWTASWLAAGPGAYARTG